MSLKLTYDLTTPDGQKPDVLSQIIKARTKELGETTQNACVAVTINILKSIRAQTKIAKPNSTPDLTIENMDSVYTPSWKGIKGGKPRPCLRAGVNGAEVNPGRVIWIVPQYQKGVQWHSYHVTDNVASDKKYEYLIVALSEGDALAYVKKIRKTRINKRKGLARVAVGLAMHKVHESQAIPQANELIQKTANNLVEAHINNQGFDSGVTNVFVHDKLDYATAALFNGAASVDSAVRNAIVKMIGYIQKRVGNNNSDIMQSLKISKEEMMAAGV